ncbi:MAG: hypothetical protein H7318_04275 [Oligoflexus sp.]|nr:hypothetical protein [Oligoflexus sp.]
MKKMLGTSILALGLMTLTACGQQDKQESSETKGLGGLVRSVPSAFSFNMADFIAKNHKSSPLAPFSKNSTTLIGNKAALALESNLVVNGSEESGSLSADYFIYGHALSKSFVVVDVVVKMGRKPVNGSYSIRSIGKTMQEGKLSSAINYQVTRDYTYAIPGTALSAVGFYGTAGVGGEVAIQGIPELVPSRSSIAFSLNPSAAFFSKLDLGAAVASGIAKAGLSGNVRLFDAKEPVYAELGIDLTEKAFGIFKANPLEVKAMGGKLEAVVTVGVVDLLPAAMQNFWRKYLEKQWKWQVLDIAPTVAINLPGTTVGFGSAADRTKVVSVVK